MKFLFHLGGITHGDGGFDDHHGLRVDAQHILNHRLNRACVEVVGLRVVVGGGGDDNVVRPGVGFLFIQRRTEVEGFVGQVVLDLSIFNGGLPAVEHVYFGGDDVDRHNFIVLGQQDSIGQTYVTGADNGDFQSLLFRAQVDVIAMLFEQ